MGFNFGSLIAPVLSVAGGLFGQDRAQSRAEDQANAAAQLQFERQKKLMEMQHDYQVADYQHRYQWSAQDMRAAGFNPILAATSGIGGSISGVSAGEAGMAATPVVSQDFGRIGEVFNSARSISQQKEIAKMQNDVELGKLQVERENVESAKQQRENDIAISQGRFELEKWTAHENMRLKELMQDATIKNMAERLQADIEHMARQDANGAVSAAAAMAQANASGLMAQVQERLGISREELNKAQEAYVALQSENAEESLKWQRWLNDHPVTRGAVGLLGSFFDTFALVKGVKNIGNSVVDMVD